MHHHIEAGNHPATLRRDTMVGGVKAGSWLHRQFTTWTQLDPGQRDLLAHLGLTPDQIQLPAPKIAIPSIGPRRRRSFEQHTTLLRAFVERHGRPPGAREWIEADGERVMIGPWLSKTRTKHRNKQLIEGQSKLTQEILRENWTASSGTTEEECPDPSEVS
ncbi:hypothetical protein [Streptomyces sp. NPDC017556]|uniref:hypothetical protein n=1 Tax=unclassified Streptomyces TaxID=2593676 RepID=UPI0037AE5F88